MSNKNKFSPKIDDIVWTIVKHKFHDNTSRFSADAVRVKGILTTEAQIKYYTSGGKRHDDEIFPSIKSLLQSLLDYNNEERDYRAKKVNMILIDYDDSNIKD